MEVKNMGAKLLPLQRISELEYRKKESNRIVMGVVYEKKAPTRLANGALYICWNITDLRSPDPKCISIHLQGSAFGKWRKGKDADAITRGSIIAVMNPSPIEVGSQSKSSNRALRVESANAILNLGMCPSLGMCNMKGCELPCNSDRGDRFCAMHLSLAYADKSVRVAIGGGSASAARLVDQIRPKKRTVRMEPCSEAPSHDPDITMGARLRNAQVYEDRIALRNVDPSGEYVKAIKRGDKPESIIAMRMPVLGRDMDENDSLEVDLVTTTSDERDKAERMLNQRNEAAIRAESKAKEEWTSYEVSRRGLPDAIRSEPKRRRVAVEKEEPKMSLGELSRALTAKRAARRAGAEVFQRPDQVQQELGVPIAANSADSMDLAVALDRAKALIAELEALPDDVECLQRVLKAGCGLPDAAVLQSGLYGIVGNIALKASRPDIRHLAVCGRRRWRAANCTAQAARAAKPTIAPSEPGDLNSIQPPDEGVTGLSHAAICGPEVAEAVAGVGDSTVVADAVNGPLKTLGSCSPCPQMEVCPHGAAVTHISRADALAESDACPISSMIGTSEATREDDMVLLNADLEAGVGGDSTTMPSLIVAGGA